MALKNHHLLLLFFPLLILHGESADPSAQFCNQNSNSTSQQTSKNIDLVLTKLVQAASQMGYAATAHGDPSNKVYGLAQCRGDVSSQDCAACVQEAASEIRKTCPDKVDARIWYEYCLLRYDTKNFIGQVDTGYGTFYYNVENVTDPETFNKNLGALTYLIDSQAVSPSNKGLGTGESKLSDLVTLYALAQCTRDLSPLSCAQCLAIAVANFPTYCDNKKGCRIIYSSCYVRYELYPFFFPLDSKKALEGSSSNKYFSIVSKP